MISIIIFIMYIIGCIAVNFAMAGFGQMFIYESLDFVIDKSNIINSIYNEYLNDKLKPLEQSPIKYKYTKYIIYLIIGFILITIYALKTSTINGILGGLCGGLFITTINIISLTNRILNISTSLICINIDNTVKLSKILLNTDKKELIDSINILLDKMEKQITSLNIFKWILILISGFLIGLSVYSIFLIF